MPVDIHLPLCELIVTLRTGLAHDCVRSSCCRTASLRFQPTKRPQIPSQKPKAKVPGVTSTLPVINTLAQGIITSNTSTTLSRPPPKTSIADWTGDGDGDDVNGFYEGEKRQRGGRKKRKKGNKEESHVVQNWDDIYDPSRPNNYEDYKNSDEKIREVREWKDRLYAHRINKQDSDVSDSEDEARSMPQMSSMFSGLLHVDGVWCGTLMHYRPICSPSNVICAFPQFPW